MQLCKRTGIWNTRTCSRYSFRLMVLTSNGHNVSPKCVSCDSPFSGSTAHWIRNNSPFLCYVLFLVFQNLLSKVNPSPLISSLLSQGLIFSFIFYAFLNCWNFPLVLSLVFTGFIFRDNFPNAFLFFLDINSSFSCVSLNFSFHFSLLLGRCLTIMCRLLISSLFLGL